jgi:hypothetical protein
MLAGPMVIFTLAASAQTPSSVPNPPTETKPTVTTPSVPDLPTEAKPTVTTPSLNSSSGTSIPATAQTPNPIDQAKTEAECKIPTNASKPECIELMLKK